MVSRHLGFGDLSLEPDLEILKVRSDKLYVRLVIVDFFEGRWRSLDYQAIVLEILQDVSHRLIPSSNGLLRPAYFSGVERENFSSRGVFGAHLGAHA